MSGTCECVNCLWFDICEYSLPCEFFTPCDDDMSDEELGDLIESNRADFYEWWDEYVGELSDLIELNRADFYE